MSCPGCKFKNVYHW